MNWFVIIKQTPRVAICAKFGFLYQVLDSASIRTACRVQQRLMERLAALRSACTFCWKPGCCVAQCFHNTTVVQCASNPMGRSQVYIHLTEMISGLDPCGQQ
jgi:alpha-ketoglutarate-dependent taurine dioxygenase